MNPTDPIKLVAELLDLPIQDKDGRWCGVVDDVELSGSPGKQARLAALLVGPGAYRGRMPRWLFAISRRVLGDDIVRVPIAEVETIGSSVKLKCAATKLKLGSGDEKARAWVPRWGAL
jgi:sporulation protein YlmC with PRC-barrel domain